MPTLDIVSRDTVLRHAIHEQMVSSTGWLTMEIPALAEALTIWEERTPQAILLDAAALDENAPRLVAIVNARKPPALLFIIGEPPDILEESLVTEFFSKPLRLGYLLVRLHFYQQPHHHTSSATYVLKQWDFSPRARQLKTHTGNEIIHLTHKESSLLEYLCQSKNPMPRDELLAAIWGYDGGIDTHTLETHIYRLRQAVPEGRDLFIVEDGTYRINPAWLTD